MIRARQLARVLPNRLPHRFARRVDGDTVFVHQRQGHVPIMPAALSAANERVEGRAGGYRCWVSATPTDWGDSAGHSRGAWRAVRGLGVRSLGLAAPGAAVILAAAYLGSRPGESWDWLAIVVIGLTLVVTVGGFGGLYHVARMCWCLRRGPWRFSPARFEELSFPFLGNGQPCLVLGEDGEHVLSVPTWEWRWRALEPYDRREVWFCGRGGGSGVVFLPEEERVFWARRILIPPLRRALRRRVLGVRGPDR